MIALVGVELRRIFARRLVRIAAGLVLLVIVVAAAVAGARSHRMRADEVGVLQAEARADYRHELDACRNGEYGIPDSDIPEGSTLAEVCGDTVKPPPIRDTSFDLVVLPDIFMGTSGPLIILLMVLGASFIGAEWHAGTVTTLLSWEPRRVRVLAAKAIATAAFALLAVIVVQGVLGAALLPAAFRGTTEGADGAWLLTTGGVVARGAAMAAAAALIGFAIAAIGRNTAAAIGVGFVYIAILEPMLRAFRPNWQPWFLYDNVSTVVVGHSADFTRFGRSALGAAMVVAGYALVLLTAAAAQFRQRDVT